MKTRIGRYTRLPACAAGLTAALMPGGNATAGAVWRPWTSALTLADAPATVHSHVGETGMRHRCRPVERLALNML